MKAKICTRFPGKKSAKQTKPRLYHRQRKILATFDPSPSSSIKVSQFGWNYTFSGGKFPISTELCDSLSLPNVGQTCKLVNNTLTGPEGSSKLLFKN